ncbi:MAG: 30S ribosomal protein S20 [Patescibacteria group bacterium]
MPNLHAAIKDLRKNKKHAVLNAKIKTHTKALEHQFFGLVKLGKKDEAKELARKIQQASSKAAKRHIVHSNKAGRHISRVQKTLNAMK